MRDKKTQHVIGLDLDGVIADHTENRLRLAAGFGFSLASHDTAADIIGTRIPYEVHTAIQHQIYDDPRIALTASLIDGAQKSIEWFKARGMSYFLISRRKNRDMAIKLLKRHNLWPMLFNEENSEFVITPEDKNESAKKYGITIYIDDEPDVLRALTFVPHKFLLDTFGAHEDSDIYTRITSWGEFRDAVENLQGNAISGKIG